MFKKKFFSELSDFLEVKYNPQNEMFLPLKTRRSVLKNETYPKSPFFKKIRPGFAGGLDCPGSVF